MHPFANAPVVGGGATTEISIDASGEMLAEDFVVVGDTADGLATSPLKVTEAGIMTLQNVGETTKMIMDARDTDGSFTVFMEGDGANPGDKTVSLSLDANGAVSTVRADLIVYSPEGGSRSVHLQEISHGDTDFASSTSTTTVAADSASHVVELYATPNNTGSRLELSSDSGGGYAGLTAADDLGESCVIASNSTGIATISTSAAAPVAATPGNEGDTIFTTAGIYYYKSGDWYFVASTVVV